MKTSVKAVKVIGDDGEVRFIDIRTESGDLKYVFLSKLAETHSLVLDERVERILRELIHAYATSRHNQAEIAKMCDELSDSVCEEVEALADSYPGETQDNYSDAFTGILRDLHLEQSELH